MNSDRRAVLIFDWDDTICPSSFVDKSQIETFDDLPLHVSFMTRLCPIWIGLPCSQCSRVLDKSPGTILVMDVLFSLPSLLLLPLPITQFQKLFNELGKCAAKCLEAASRHGEVSITSSW